MFRSLPILAATLILAAPAAAQVAPPPVVATDPAPPVPEPTATPTPLPAATPGPAPSPIVELPQPVPTPTPRATPTPAASPTPLAVEAPLIAPDAVAPTPTPTPTPTPNASPSPLAGAVTTSVPAPARDEGGGWLLWGGIALMLLAAAIVARVLMPRRREPVEPEREIEPPSPAATPVPVAVAPSAATAAAVDYRPGRIGLNLVSVTVTGEVLIANAGDAPMHDVRVRASLLAAAAGHERAITVLHDAPAGRLAAPAFALDPGATRPLRLVVAAARSEIEPLSVAGRPMMVPLVAVTVDWRDAGGGHRRTQAFAVGVERVDSPKLAPVWLDQDGRTFDAVAARRHGDPIG